MERQNERAEENDVATHDHVIFRLLALFLEFQKSRYVMLANNRINQMVQSTTLQKRVRSVDILHSHRSQIDQLCF